MKNNFKALKEILNLKFCVNISDFWPWNTPVDAVFAFVDFMPLFPCAPVFICCLL